MENGVSVPEGIIIPPPEVKKIVTKTAGYVHRNGRAFGEKIQRKEGEKSKKFSFLNPNDAYNAYFEWILSQLEQGVEINTEGSETPVKAAATLREDKARVLEFAPDIPPISPLDLDIIKQTALYVAKNGFAFQKHIVQRSGDSVQFEFLKHSHSLHPLYQSFVDQYRRVLDNDFKLGDKGSVLHSSRLRAEQEAIEREKRKQQKKEEEAERIAYAQIDWHDFALVETIEFTHADMEMDLPLPITIEQIQYASLEEKRRGVYKIEEAPPDYDSEEESQPPQRPPPQRQPPPRQPQPPLEEEPEQELPLRSEPVETAPAEAAPSIPGMKIKPKGTSRLRKQQQSERKIRDPITGQLVAESEYDQHMRISQLNPEYKKYKDIEQQRMATTNLSTSEEAARNLKRLVDPVQEEQDAKKRKTVQWDGYSSSRVQTREAAAVSQEEKRRARKEQHERENAIGPKRH